MLTRIFFVLLLSPKKVGHGTRMLPRIVLVSARPGGAAAHCRKLRCVASALPYIVRKVYDTDHACCVHVYFSDCFYIFNFITLTRLE
jgi:hypothetical protein